MSTPGIDTATPAQQTLPVRSPPAREGLIGMTASIALLHVAGWGTLLAVALPEHLSVGTTAFGLGVGVTAYLLGVRHAFDADHIAAIDNTTRKMMQQGKRAASVGFWFSLGHSSVVFALTLLLALGFRTVVGPVLDDDSELHVVTGLISTVASSGFLFTIAALNVVVLLEVWRTFQRRHSDNFDEAALERQLDNRGFMNRLLGRVTKLVSEPWQMYIVGLLFGLGFDTASEIALLVLTSSGAESGLPWYTILCLPVLFAAGMSLFDTLDGSLMTAAYGWALAKPVRKIYYNLIVTSLSIAVALIIGTIEILGLLGERFNLRGSTWSWATSIDLSRVGFIVVGLFVATWMAAVSISKYRRFETR